ncbi:hypothetical protein RHOSPDRAFT_31841 [Rhodotorula sp. JG-1b]|nr:hypothetical protein RHOSPDRAFT_31841 [Rhodotorula sp. JG-1b]
MARRSTRSSGPIQEAVSGPSSAVTAPLWEFRSAVIKPSTPNRCKVKIGRTGERRGEEISIALDEPRDNVDGRLASAAEDILVAETCKEIYRGASFADVRAGIQEAWRGYCGRPRKAAFPVIYRKRATRVLDVEAYKGFRDFTVRVDQVIDHPNFDIADYPLDEQGRGITPSTKSLLESDEPGIGDTARFVCHVLIEFGDSVAQQPSNAAQFRLAAEKKLNMSFSSYYRVRILPANPLHVQLMYLDGNTTTEDAPRTVWAAPPTRHKPSARPALDGSPDEVVSDGADEYAVQVEAARSFARRLQNLVEDVDHRISWEDVLDRAEELLTWVPHSCGHDAGSDIQQPSAFAGLTPEEAYLYKSFQSSSYSPSKGGARPIRKPQDWLTAAQAVVPNFLDRADEETRIVCGWTGYSATLADVIASGEEPYRTIAFEDDAYRQSVLDLRHDPSFGVDKPLQYYLHDPYGINDTVALKVINRDGWRYPRPIRILRWGMLFNDERITSLQRELAKLALAGTDVRSAPEWERISSKISERERGQRRLTEAIDCFYGPLYEEPCPWDVRQAVGLIRYLHIFGAEQLYYDLVGCHTKLHMTTLHETLGIKIQNSADLDAFVRQVCYSDVLSTTKLAIRLGVVEKPPLAERRTDVPPSHPPPTSTTTDLLQQCSELRAKIQAKDLAPGLERTIWTQARPGHIYWPSEALVAKVLAVAQVVLTELAARNAKFKYVTAPTPENGMRILPRFTNLVEEDETVVVAEVKRFSAGAIYSKIPPKYQENEPRPYDEAEIFASLCYQAYFDATTRDGLPADAERELHLGVDARYHTVPLRPCTLFGSKNPQAPSLGRTDHNRFYVSGFGRPPGEDMVHDFTLSNFDPNNANFRLISTCTNTSEAGGSKAETDAQCDMLAVSLRKLFLRERDGGSWPEDEMTHDGEWKFLRDALSDKDNISINKFLEVTRQAYDDLSLLRPFLSYALHVVEDDAQALADVKSLWGPAYDAARVSRMAKEREGRWQHAEALGKSECRDEGADDEVANDTLVEEKKRKYDGHTERTRTAAKAAKR